MKTTDSSDEKYHIRDIDVNACSTTDCTGLIPSLPQSKAELESYNDLYRFEPEAAAVNGDDSQDHIPAGERTEPNRTR